MRAICRRTQSDFMIFSAASAWDNLQQKMGIASQTISPEQADCWPRRIPMLFSFGRTRRMLSSAPKKRSHAHGVLCHRCKSKSAPHSSDDRPSAILGNHIAWPLHLKAEAVHDTSTLLRHFLGRTWSWPRNCLFGYLWPFYCRRQLRPCSCVRWQKSPTR